jgi:ABC-type transport system substrate-binding protein
VPRVPGQGAVASPAVRRLRRHVSVRTAALLLVAALALAACSSDDDATDDAGSSPTTGADGGSDGGSDGTTGTAPAATTTTAVDRTGGVLRIAVNTGVTSFDPAFAVRATDLLFTDLVHDGLVALDATGAPVPALAASWDVSDDQRTFTFTLAEGRTFHDGTPVTPADVMASVQRMAAPGVATPHGSTLEAIAGYRAFHAGETATLAGVVALDDRTVQITTTEPDAPLVAALGNPGFAVVPAAGATVAPSVQIVGAGPFSLVNGDAPLVSLTRFDGYPTPALLDGVELVVVADDADGYARFERGEVDVAQVPQPQVADAVARYGDAGVRPYAASVWFGISTTSDALADPRLRQAVLAAVDRNAVVASVLPGATVAAGIVPAAAGGAPCGAPCTYDPARAAALAAEAFPDGDIPTISVDHGPDPVDTALADAVAAQIGAAGIPAEAVGHDDYAAFLASGDQQVFRWGWTPDAPVPGLVLGPVFASGRPDDLTGFSDPEVDRQLAAANGSADPAARTAAWDAVQTAVHGAAVVIPLVDATTRWVLSAQVHDLVLGPMGGFDPTVVWVSER